VITAWIIICMFTYHSLLQNNVNFILVKYRNLALDASVFPMLCAIIHTCHISVCVLCCDLDRLQLLIHLFTSFKEEKNESTYIYGILHSSFLVIAKCYFLWIWSPSFLYFFKDMTASNIFTQPFLHRNALISCYFFLISSEHALFFG
jgi:hypothetical protein